MGKEKPLKEIRPRGHIEIARVTVLSHPLTGFTKSPSASTLRTLSNQFLEKLGPQLWSVVDHLTDSLRPIGNGSFADQFISQFLDLSIRWPEVMLYLLLDFSSLDGRLHVVLLLKIHISNPNLGR